MPDTERYQDPYDAAALRAEVVRPGGRWQRLDVVAETGSTNADLAAAARAGAPAGTVLVADHQVAGRGRRNRSWTAPPGSSIALSVLLRPAAGPPISWLPLLVGLAVSDALRAAADVPAVMKWPNDVLVDGAKICGILAERVETPTGSAVVVGAGVNVALTAADLPVPTATSLALLASGPRHHRGPLVAAILADLDLWLGRWEAGAQQQLAGAYASRCATLGRTVSVLLHDRTLTGTAERVDADGRLVLRHDGRETVVGAGDVVHLRGSDPGRDPGNHPGREPGNHPGSDPEP